MGIDINEEDIKKTPQDTYRKKIKYLVRKAAFKELLEKKNEISKIKNIEYESYDMQLYLKSNSFNCAERNLLYSLRSRMHPAKNNFRRCILIIFNVAMDAKP